MNRINSAIMKFLKELSADFAGRAEDTLAKLRQLLGIFFESSKYLLAYSCEESERMLVLEQALNFCSFTAAVSCCR